MKLFSQATPIWSCAKGEEIDQYRIFRKKFTIETTPNKVTLDIAADSTFNVFVNGSRLPIQQLADFPKDRTVSRYDISSLLNVGENIIAIEVHYLGRRFLTYQPGEAFVCAEIYNDETIFAATNESWKVETSSDYQSNLNCLVTSQLGLVFLQDARKSIAFEAIDFDDSKWQNAVKVSNSENWQFSLRQIPQLLELPSLDADIVQMGYLKREKELTTFAETSFRDYLSSRHPREFFSSFDDSLLVNGSLRRKFHCKGNGELHFTLEKKPNDVDGYYIIVDLKKETVGYLNIEINLPSGAVLDISHGEHLDDGRVRSLIGPRNFTDRYIAKDGWNHIFYSHRRIGARYLELHITNCQDNQIEFRYATLVPTEVPLPKETEFICEDRLLHKINEVSIDTLKLCMHEHYEDCPWREQGLYPYDSRNQILYGYHIWGNYDYAAACLDLLGKSYDGKRYLELTAPGYTTLTIPVFTMVWITELYEYYLYSGSSKLTNKWINQVDLIIDAALAETVEDNPNLYHSGIGDKIWNFSEWNGKLSSLKEHPQAPYNVYFVEAMRSAAKLHESLGNEARAQFLQEKADNLGKAIEEACYSSKNKYYNAVANQDDEGYEHIQAIMLANDLVPENKVTNLYIAFGIGKLKGIDFSALYYLVQAMAKGDSWSRHFLLNYLRQILEPVVLSGATSLWETRQGADDFSLAGSLCHGWSSVMPYVCKHVLLGITPLSAGFKKFEVKPYASSLSRAMGSMPTPYGPIKVSWEKKDDRLYLEVQHPLELECIVNEYPESPIAEQKITAYGRL